MSASDRDTGDGYAAPRVHADVGELSRAVAGEIVRLADRPGPFNVALSGGGTPRTLYTLLAEEYRDVLPWERIHLYWGDERYVPHDDSASNYRMVRETLIDRVPIPAVNVHPMPTGFDDPDLAARVYAGTLETISDGSGPVFDLALMGMGEDGHTASLFPGGPELVERTRTVVASRAPVEPHRRLTLTFPVFDRARALFFLVAGAGKRSVLTEIFADKAAAALKYPSAMLDPAGRMVWFVDREAWEPSAR